MKNKKLFQKAVLIALIVIVLFSLLVPAIFSQTPVPAQEKLLNGLKVLMWPDAKADNVVLRVRVHAGSAFDPQGREGMMQMLAANLFPTEASREFFSEDLGGSLDVVTTYDYIQINASAKPEHFLTMLETVSAAVSNVAIDKDTTATLRKEQLGKIAANEKDAAFAADSAVMFKLFGTAPYGRRPMGTADSVQKIDFADLTEAKARFLTADNATVAIAGKFSKDLAFRAARRYFGGWLKADRRVPSTFAQPDDFSVKASNIVLNGTGTPASRAAVRAAGRQAADYYATLIFNTVRVNQKCAEEATYRPNLLSGVYWVKDVPETDACSFKGAAAVSQEQFDAAKSVVVANLRSRVGTTVGLADMYLDTDTYRLQSPDDEIKKASAVTLADVKTVAAAITTAPTARVTVAYAPETK